MVLIYSHSGVVFITPFKSFISEVVNDKATLAGVDQKGVVTPILQTTPRAVKELEKYLNLQAIFDVQVTIFSCGDTMLCMNKNRDIKLFNERGLWI